jgi:hypothetical protein
MDYLHRVDWAAVDNVFLTTARERCENDEVLDSLSTFTYSEDVMVDLMRPILNAAVTDARGTRSMLRGVKGTGSFVNSVARPERLAYYFSVHCWSKKPARRLAQGMAELFDEVGLNGYTHCAGTNVIMATNTITEYAKMHDIMGAMDLVALRNEVQALRLDVFCNVPKPEALAVTVPYCEGGQDLADLADDTFTLDVFDKKRVLVLDTLSEVPDDREHIGVYLSEEELDTMRDMMPGMVFPHIADIDAVRVVKGPCVSAYTVEMRNLSLVSQLIKRGFHLRPSWYKLVGFDTDEAKILLMFGRFMRSEL